ncbi:uncharacterized protein LOC121385636 [Gigantopelta aegis]|uniref:uncharacterized protein LOC121385636 n=1 Tax=Gigantopelta aegis TaxID=1735272 RepID=UPI001B889E8E|nr:uncharacterized protein LOC121385636 [Gigantopelta aegis]
MWGSGEDEAGEKNQEHQEEEEEEEEYTLFDRVATGKEYVMMVKHEPGFLVIIVVNFLVLIVTIFFNVEVQPIPQIHINNLFVNGYANISDSFPLEITPASWTYSLWGAVFAWQLVWAIYSLVSIFRKTSEGPVYLCPVLLPRFFFLLFSLGLCFNIGWMFLWDRMYVSIAFIFAFLMTFTLFGALVLSYRGLGRNSYLLKSLGRRADLWMVRVLVQNGVAFYATWSALIALLDLGSVLSYAAIPQLDVGLSSTIVLGLVSGFVVVYFLVDIFLADRYSRYTVSPYVVMIVFLTGVFVTAWRGSTLNGVFSLSLLATCSTLSLIKLFYICLQEATTPKEKELDILKELDETRSLLK